jgi:hypothetical protein
MTGDLFGPYLGMPVEVARWDGDGPHRGRLYICRDGYKVAKFFDGVGTCHMETAPGADGIWRPVRRRWGESQ